MRTTEIQLPLLQAEHRPLPSVRALTSNPLTFGNRDQIRALHVLEQVLPALEPESYGHDLAQLPLFNYTHFKPVSTGPGWCQLFAELKTDYTHQVYCVRCGLRNSFTIEFVETRAKIECCSRCGLGYVLDSTSNQVSVSPYQPNHYQP